MAGLDNAEGGVPSLNIPSSNASIAGGGGTSNKDLMEEARESLAGNWGMGVLGYVLSAVLLMSISFFVFAAALFVGVVSGLTGGNADVASSMISVFSNVFQLVIIGPLMVGFYGFYLGLAQEDEGRLEQLFIGFRRFWKSLGAYFFYVLFIYLWILVWMVVPLLVLSAVSMIPGMSAILTYTNIAASSLIIGSVTGGIIAAFRYATAFFIIADDEDCGPLEAITRSKEMMKGNKWKFFCLHFRFIGWSLLALFFTLGIGFLWVVPYMQTSLAKFYEDVK